MLFDKIVYLLIKGNEAPINGNTGNYRLYSHVSSVGKYFLPTVSLYLLYLR